MIAAGERKLHFAKYGYLKTAGFNETSKISIYLIESNIEHYLKLLLAKYILECNFMTFVIFQGLAEKNVRKW